MFSQAPGDKNAQATSDTSSKESDLSQPHMHVRHKRAKQGEAVLFETEQSKAIGSISHTRLCSVQGVTTNAVLEVGQDAKFLLKLHPTEVIACCPKLPLVLQALGGGDIMAGCRLLQLLADRVAPDCSPGTISR